MKIKIMQLSQFDFKTGFWISGRVQSALLLLLLLCIRYSGKHDFCEVAVGSGAGVVYVAGVVYGAARGAYEARGSFALR